MERQSRKNRAFGKIDSYYFQRQKKGRYMRPFFSTRYLEISSKQRKGEEDQMPKPD